MQSFLGPRISLKATFIATGASFSPAAAAPGLAQKKIVEVTQTAGKAIRRTDMKGSLWRDFVEEGQPTCQPPHSGQRTRVIVGDPIHSWSRPT